MEDGEGGNPSNKSWKTKERKGEGEGGEKCETKHLLIIIRTLIELDKSNMNKKEQEEKSKSQSKIKKRRKVQFREKQWSKKWI